MQGAPSGTLFLYQLCMVLNGFLYPLRFNTDIALRGGGGTVLQQALDEGDIIAIVLVNLCGIPFTKTVGADALEPQIVTDYL